MRNKMNKTRKIGILAMFIAIGMVLQYVESRIIVTTVPGGKLGLANAVSIINIFMFGGGNAIVVATLRSFLTCIISGNMSALFYSLSGAFFSSLAMWIVKLTLYPRVSLIGISIIGAVIHNTAQVFVAAIVFSSFYVFSYLPGLMILALISGTITGYAAEIFSKRVFKEVLK